MTEIALVNSGSPSVRCVNAIEVVCTLKSCHASAQLCTCQLTTTIEVLRLFRSSVVRFGSCTLRSFYAISELRIPWAVFAGARLSSLGVSIVSEIVRLTRDLIFDVWYGASRLSSAIA